MSRWSGILASIDAKNNHCTTVKDRDGQWLFTAIWHGKTRADLSRLLDALIREYDKLDDALK